MSECREKILNSMLRKKEEISFLESDLDKIKVTVQKVEEEVSKIHKTFFL